MDTRPIGVFDSGLGGLTVIRELEKILPGEDIVYFGDTGRLPYGTKGKDTITKFAAQDIRFLHSFDVKAIIIACGTVSSVAFEETSAASSVPVFGVVKPAVNAAIKATKSGRIGVIGTSATIRSGTFEKEILSINPKAQVTSRACPLFVPLVESGHFEKGDNLTTLAAHEYLDELKQSGIDTLILGCTHYPLLRDIIGEVMQGVTLIDAGGEAARAAQKAFAAMNILSSNRDGGKCRFYVSDYTDDFARLASILLAHSLSGYVEKTDIEKY